MISLENLNIPDLAVVTKKEDLQEINLRVYQDVVEDATYYFRLTCEDNDLIYCEFVSKDAIIDEKSSVSFILNSFGETYSIPEIDKIVTFKWEVLVLKDYDVTKSYNYYLDINKKLRGFSIYFVDFN